MISKFERFTAAISHIDRCIQKIERVEMAKYGLKGPHAQCLLAMKKYAEGITAARLCEVCDKDKAAISRILSELAEAGMILRENRNGSRYRAMLRLTEQGKAAANAVMEKARLAVELAGKGFGEEEREIFYRVLSIISGNLHKLCRDGLMKSEE